MAVVTGTDDAPQCNDCGMNHEPDDKAACIEGHGDDPGGGTDMEPIS